MITCALPDFNSDDLVSFQNPAKFWILFTIYVIAALYLLCSLVSELTSLITDDDTDKGFFVGVCLHIP